PDMVTNKNMMRYIKNNSIETKNENVCELHVSYLFYIFIKTASFKFSYLNYRQSKMCSNRRQPKRFH
ncbi:unnamed protein product, partial [Candidula unifasciata]